MQFVQRHSHTLAARSKGSSISERRVSIKTIHVVGSKKLLEILDIENACFPPGKRLGTFGFPSYVQTRSNGLLVAETDTHVCGYLLFSRSASSGEISKVAVLETERRRGIANCLLRRGIEELSTSGRRAPPEITLHVDPSRTGARQLYESHGFREHAVLPRYFEDGRTAIVMRLLTGAGVATPDTGSSVHTELG
jgi:ribosomal protein S18 acetylase RimI-like enzyme